MWCCVVLRDAAYSYSYFCCSSIQYSPTEVHQLQSRRERSTYTNVISLPFLSFFSLSFSSLSPPSFPIINTSYSLQHSSTNPARHSVAVGAGWNAPHVDLTRTPAHTQHLDHSGEDDMVPPSPSKMSSIVSFF